MGRRLSGSYLVPYLPIPVIPCFMLFGGSLFILSYLVDAMSSVFTVVSTKACEVIELALSPRPRRSHRSRCSRAKARKFRRRQLPYHLVRRCLTRDNSVYVIPVFAVILVGGGESSVYIEYCLGIIASTILQARAYL